MALVNQIKKYLISLGACNLVSEMDRYSNIFDLLDNIDLYFLSWAITTVPEFKPYLEDYYKFDQSSYAIYIEAISFFNLDFLERSKRRMQEWDNHILRKRVYIKTLALQAIHEKFGE